MLFSSSVLSGLLVVGTLASEALASSASGRNVQKPNLCPSSCIDYDSSGWYVYPSMSRVARCNETMLLDFNIHNDLTNSNMHSTIHACSVGDLDTLTGSIESVSSARISKSSIQYQLGGWTATTDTSKQDTSTGLLTDLKSYLTGNPQKGEIFAYSNGVVVGAYFGGSLQIAENVDLVIEKLTSFLESSSYVDTAIQFCGTDSNHTVGVAVNVEGDISTVQDYVQSWNNGNCVSGAERNISVTSDLWSSKSASTTTISNSTLSVRSSRGSRIAHSSHYSHPHLHQRRSTCSYVTVVSGDTCTTLVSECGITSTEFYSYNTASDLCSTLAVGQTVCCSSGSEPDLSPSAYDNGTCYTHYVESGDSCSDLASEYSLTTAKINTYNNATWGWFGCDNLQAGQSMCLSTGNPPYPLAVANAECGPQMPNTTFTSDDSDTWADLNPCPLNACCDSYGQCGTTPQYCTYNATSTGPPGTDNCISNCGTTITNWAVEPSSYSKVGYYEASSVNRSCLQMDALSIDTSQWTHINFAFGNIDQDFSINVDGMEDQFEHFLELSDVKRLVSFGGWDFSTSTDTYMIFRNGVKSANRATFAKQVAAFVEETGLDGVDFDWEYPSEPDIEGIPAGDDDEADNYLEFLKEVKDALPTDTLLSVTLPSSYWYLKPFPVSEMSDVVDYFNYMTYDMHGTWDEGSEYADWGCEDGNCLFSHVNMTETMWALAMLTKAGVGTSQIMVGVTSYGRSFEMTTAGCYEAYCTWDAAGDAGPCTDTAGYISNAEINQILAENSDSKVISTNITDILVYNSTQWVGYMTNKTKVERQAYYETYNFGGTAEWAIDLEQYVSYDNSSSDAVETGGETITIDPMVWTEPTPAVTCAPPCYMIMPPKPLTKTTTITFPQWNTQVVWRATETQTTTFSDGSVMTFNSYDSYTIPTSISIAPVETDYINVWNQQITLGQTSVDQTSSIQATPFPITFTPTVGGTTQVTGGTTSIMPAQTWTYGNLTYTKSAWTGVFGGTTSVTSGTTLSPTTSTVTPQPYPTDMSSKDTEINTKTTTVHASTKSGSSGPKATSTSEHVGSECVLFCFGCAICPPGYASSEVSSGGGSSGSGGSDDDDDDDTTSTNSEISSSTSSGGTYITAAGAAKTLVADAFPTTVDPTATVEAVASRIKSLLSANYADVQSSLTAGVYASVYSTAAPICEVAQDPDSGDVGSWCTCSGSTDRFATLSGSSACDYTLMPTGTSAVATGTVITTVIVQTITSTADTSASIGRFDLAAEYNVYYGGLSPQQHTYYDLNYFSSGVTNEEPCSASYRERIGIASPTPTTWSAVPEHVTWDYATWTVGGSKWTDCIYTNTAAPSYGDGGTLVCDGSTLPCTSTSVPLQICLAGTTTVLPLVSCPVSASTTSVHTITTTETLTYTSY